MLKSFCRKWQNKSVEDDGAYPSQEFIKFANELHSVLKIDARDHGYRLFSFNCGHYDVSGFFEKDGRYVYFSYDVPRGGAAIDFRKTDPCEGVLFRTASGPEDYRGGTNRFCSMNNLMSEVQALLYKEVFI
jgi:hypothetical protein